jgi:hypothetical protein
VSAAWSAEKPLYVPWYTWFEAFLAVPLGIQLGRVAGNGIGQCRSADLVPTCIVEYELHGGKVTAQVLNLETGDRRKLGARNRCSHTSKYEHDQDRTS